MVLTGRATPGAPAAAASGGQASAKRSRRWLGLVSAVLLLLVVGCLSIVLGTRDVPLQVAFDALFSFDPTNADHVVVRDLRVPRTVVGLLAGVALGLTGTLMQGVTRNPLADPGLLGINSGASLAVLVAITTFGITSPGGFVWFAFGGAAAAGVAVYAIGSAGMGGASPVRLALVGAALNAVVTSVITVILTTDYMALSNYRFWSVGSLAGRDTDSVLAVAPFLVGGVAIALLLGPTMNVLALGDDVARALGQRVRATRLTASIAVVFLAGSATALAGPLVFVGLVAPHLVRGIAGPDYRWILPLSALLAPTLLLAADVIGRLIVQPGELEAGIVFAFLGAPLLLALVRRSRVGTP